MTMYPSQVVEKYNGLKQDPVYGRRDPIREIVWSKEQYLQDWPT